MHIALCMWNSQNNFWSCWLPSTLFEAGSFLFFISHSAIQLGSPQLSRQFSSFYLPTWHKSNKTTNVYYRIGFQENSGHRGLPDKQCYPQSHLMTSGFFRRFIFISVVLAHIHIHVSRSCLVPWRSE